MKLSQTVTLAFASLASLAGAQLVNDDVSSTCERLGVNTEFLNIELITHFLAATLIFNRVFR